MLFCKMFSRQQNRSVCLVILSLLAAVLLPCCATNPVTKKKEFVLMSEQQEFSVGRSMDPEIRKQYGVYSSGRLQDYVTSIGERIAEVSDRPDIFFHFTVLYSPIVNAFALPGGYIYITRGLMAYLNSEAELAGVLAHEIGHVTARHAVRQYTKAAAYQIATGIASIFVPEINNARQFSDFVFVAINAGYSREYETESDRLSAGYISRAGYDPQAVSSVLRILELLDRYNNNKKNHISLFSSHPDTQKRIADIEKELLEENLQVPPPSITGKDRYLKEIDGLVFGNNIHEGVIHLNRFQHPDFRIEIFFPEKWTIKNMPDAVIAKDPDNDFQLELRHHSLNKRQSIEEAARAIVKKNGLTEINGSQQLINGLEAYTGTYEGTMRHRGSVTVRTGFFQLKNNVFFVTGISKTDEFRKALPFFEKTIKSFKKLSQEEAGNIQPNKIRLYTIKKGEGMNTLVKKYGGPGDGIKAFALINAWDPENIPELKPGMVIKILRNDDPFKP